MNLSFASLLGLIFITLKLCGIITWSWLWVLAPFWIGFIVFITIITVLAIVAILAGK